MASATPPSPNPAPVYAAETPRLYLQAMSVEEHLHDFHAMVSDEKVMGWSTKAPSKSLEQSLTYLLPYIRPAAPSDTFPLNYAVLLKSPSAPSGQKLRMIGKVGVVRKSPREEVHWEKYGGPGDELALGYLMASEFWGRGLMGEALGGFLELFFGIEENKDVPHVIAQIDPGNIASQRVMQKLGAKLREGVVRSGYVAHAGDSRDTQVWVLERPSVGDAEVAKGRQG